MAGHFHGARLLLSMMPYLMLINYSVSGSLMEITEDSDWMERDTRVKARMALLLYGTLFPAITVVAWCSCDGWYKTTADPILGIECAITAVLTAIAIVIKVRRCNDKYRIKLISMLMPLVFTVSSFILFRGII